MISANTKKRIQAISIEGKLPERNFAVTSEVPRNTVESRISVMPLNGRSERAGARRAAWLSSVAAEGTPSSLATAGISRGDEGRARSSLMAAAGGEVTAKPGQKK